jgi:hypothetical protein
VDEQAIPKKRMTGRTRVITFPMYSGYEVRITFAPDIRAVVLERYPDEAKGVGKRAEALTVIDKSGFSHIIMCPDSEASVLVHECCHAAHALHKWIGAAQEDEIFAYTVEYMFRRAMVLWNQVNKAKHKLEVPVGTITDTGTKL